MTDDPGTLCIKAQCVIAADTTRGWVQVLLEPGTVKLPLSKAALCFLFKKKTTTKRLMNTWTETDRRASFVFHCYLLAILMLICPWLSSRMAEGAWWFSVLAIYLENRRCYACGCFHADGVSPNPFALCMITSCLLFLRAPVLLGTGVSCGPYCRWQSWPCINSQLCSFLVQRLAVSHPNHW